MKTKPILAIVMLLSCAISSLTKATDVGGIISSDTTWTLAGSPYNITSIVQLAEGVTLTIEPGVEVFANDHDFEVWGTFDATGTEQSKISLNDLRIATNIGNSTIFATFCAFDSFLIILREGALTLRDSTLQNRYSSFDHGVVVYKGDCYIERNIFAYTVGIKLYDANVYIYNNVFFEQDSGTAILNDGANPIVKFNSFLSTDRVAIELGGSGSMTVAENFWNTTDTAVIDSMIYDRNDDLNVVNYISYMPILTEPHPDTPIFLTDQILTIRTTPIETDSVSPSVGEHIVSGLVDITAETFLDCPDVYRFDHWEGDVANPNSATTTVFMGSDKTVTAVFEDRRECGDECHPDDLFGDYNHDCIINFLDLAEFAMNWLVCTKPECD